jgi:hypothetical protein
MGDDTTYNGWANYPTWCVNLWLANEEPLYRETLDLATTAVTVAPTDESVADGIWTVEEAAKFRLADVLRDWVTDELAPDLGACFAADLLGWALGCVDWDELAESWVEQVDTAALAE